MSTLLPEILKGLPLDKMSYLELGVLNGQCLNRVPAKRRVGVDVKPRVKSPEIWVGTTDAYFKQAKEKFDLVLVDACHEYRQVCRDLAGCARVLQKGGLVFCHDMVPPTPDHVSPNYCWDTYRVLGWCLTTGVPCWVTTEDFGLVAFPDPGRAASAPANYSISFTAFHALLKKSSSVHDTPTFKRLVQGYLTAVAKSA